MPSNSKSYLSTALWQCGGDKDLLAAVDLVAHAWSHIGEVHSTGSFADSELRAAKIGEALQMIKDKPRSFQAKQSTQ